jgi:hypothetical protein
MESWKLLNASRMLRHKPSCSTRNKKHNIGQNDGKSIYVLKMTNFGKSHFSNKLNKGRTYQSP